MPIFQIGIIVISLGIVASYFLAQRRNQHHEENRRNASSQRQRPEDQRADQRSQREEAHTEEQDHIIAQSYDQEEVRRRQDLGLEDTDEISDALPGYYSRQQFSGRISPTEEEAEAKWACRDVKGCKGQRRKLRRERRMTARDNSSQSDFPRHGFCESCKKDVDDIPICHKCGRKMQLQQLPTIHIDDLPGSSQYSNGSGDH